MAGKSRPKTHATGPNLSGTLATMLTALADRLVLANVTNANGALFRMLLAPPIRLLAGVFRWWSRSFLGQRFGLVVSRQIYGAGRDNPFSPSEVGDSWQAFRSRTPVVTRTKH